MSENYLSELELLLSKNDEYAVEGTLNKNKIAELAHKYDAELIDTLANNKAMRRLFFTETKAGVLVFNKDKFIQFITNKEFLPDSFTVYKNKIGLATGTELLSEKKDVVLNWPYKDCVLEGGQDKEDAKRDELLHNEVLAPDQIDRLLDEKALTGWTKYDKDGGHEATQIVDTDNLIIRGNNLLALHSLKRRYSNKIQLIYIDPPYNTGNDSFNYNDRFKHSTWLTFMKNRLAVANSLLTDNGLIFVHIDHNEVAYLKVLLDEIFGRERFINQIAWKRRGGSLNQPSTFGNVLDYILVYSKSEKYYFNPQKTLDDENTKRYIEERFVHKDPDGRRYMKSPLINPSNRPTMQYEYKGYASPPKGWLVKKEKMEQFDREGRLVFPEDKTQRISKKIYLDEYEGQPVDCLWADIFVINPMSKEAVDFAGQKPEALLQRIISTATKPGDIVLDYHLGSGTTATTAHKMGRQYIGIEQLDYGDIDPVNRLVKTINGDSSGISKQVNWVGGGSFVYARLMDGASVFVEKVKKANTDKELAQLLLQAQKSSFLSYKVDPEKINPGDKDFDKLSIAHKKQLLLEIVDHNHLYVNLTEIEDADYGASAEDKKLNKQFYGN